MKRVYSFTSTEQGAIHYSLDDGQTWNTSASFSDFSGSGDGFWARGDSLYTIHNGSVYVSNDQGATWAGISALSLRFRDLSPAGSTRTCLLKPRVFINLRFFPTTGSLHVGASRPGYLTIIP